MNGFWVGKVLSQSPPTWPLIQVLGKPLSKEAKTIHVVQKNQNYIHVV